MFTVTHPPVGGGKLWPRKRPSTQEEISFEWTESFASEALQTCPLGPTCTLPVRLPETSEVRSARL